MEPCTSSLLAFVTFLTAFVVSIKWILRHWERSKIPHLKPTFLFGNLPNPLTNKAPLSIHIQEFHRRLKELKAKIGGVYLFCSPVLVVTDPELARQILIKDFQSFHERGFYHDEKHQPISANLFTLDGPKWRTLRTKHTPIFTSAKMKIMFDLMMDVEKLMDKYVSKHVANKQPLDVVDCIERGSSNFIGSCAFGINCNSFEDNTIRQILREGMDKTTAFVKISFCSAFPKLSRFLRIPLISRKEAGYIINSIEEVMEYRKKNQLTRNDFLQLMSELMDDNVVTLNELRASCIHFFMAGFESSANSSIFLLFELAHNQEIQCKLRKEINETLAKHNGEMTYEAIMDIKYLEMVMCETLRKYAPVAYLNRRCAEDFKLSDIVIKKGTDLLISVLGMQNDPEYFPDPDKFDPERFSDENRNKIVPYTYMPFGEGPRYCIGDRFAKQEIKITVANLVRKYKFKLHKPIEVPLRFKDSGLFNAPADDILFDVEEISE